MPNLALIPVDLETSRLGLPSRVGAVVAGRTVLEHTLARVARVPAVDALVLVHPAGQEPLALIDPQRVTKPVRTFADPGGLRDRWHAWRQAARKWSLASWRGGLGGMTCYDELLPAGPLAAALEAHGGAAALLVGGDWMLVDPAWCQRVLALHLQQPEAMALTFTQAPPGLAGVALSRDLLRQLADKQGTIGGLLAYQPTRPQPDPIGRDVCVQVPGQVRSCIRRFIYDTPRSAALIDRVVAALGDRAGAADASAVTGATMALDESGGEIAGGPGALPQQVTLELTPRRAVSGPIAPQAHMVIDRPPLALDAALRIVEQLGDAGAGDVALTLGGLGDALLHPDWERLVTAARAAGVFGLVLETDLLVEPAVLDRLLDLPLDVITVRLNADTVKGYERVMGADRCGDVVRNLEHLLTARNARDRAPAPGGADAARPAGLPWIVPRLIKTPDTLADMEAFFDRWTYFAGHAVIEPATSGCGLIPEASPVAMAPPKRCACRQLDRRMTIHSDGRVALCDQDWLGRGCLGDAAQTSLTEIGRATNAIRAAHHAGRWNELPLCAACREWHRP